MMSLSNGPCPAAGYGGAAQCPAKPLLRPMARGDNGSAAAPPPGSLTQPPLGRPGGRLA